ncbi:MAG: hypothetical protein AVDCRST_MAG85-2108, partial [uncultured Solirubrobacteraceae bacterium]
AGRLQRNGQARSGSAPGRRRPARRGDDRLPRLREPAGGLRRRGPDGRPRAAWLRGAGPCDGVVVDHRRRAGSAARSRVGAYGRGRVRDRGPRPVRRVRGSAWIGRDRRLVRRRPRRPRGASPGGGARDLQGASRGHRDRPHRSRAAGGRRADFLRAAAGGERAVAADREADAEDGGADAVGDLVVLGRVLVEVEARVLPVLGPRPADPRGRLVDDVVQGDDVRVLADRVDVVAHRVV